jgi:hypothetical protein
LIGIDLLIFGKSPQSLTREEKPFFVSVLPVIRIDLKVIIAHSLGLATFLHVLFGLVNQILVHAVGFPAEPIQERKSTAHGNTVFGSELNSNPCLSANSGPYLPLLQIDKAIRDAPNLAVEPYGWLPRDLSAGEGAYATKLLES